MLNPSVHELDSRRLLSLAASFLGYTGVDLTGPTAAAGPDGTQSLHIQVTGLSVEGNPATVEPVDGVTIIGPTGFNWTYGLTPNLPVRQSGVATPLIDVNPFALNPRPIDPSYSSEHFEVWRE
jgi:hypothetical protein